MRIRLALSAALGSLALFAASAAFAQESTPDDVAADPADPTGPTGDDDAGPTGDDSAAPTADDAVTTALAADASTPYPQRALDRPRTLPGGAFQATAEFTASEGSAYAGRLQGLYSPVEKVQAAVTYDYGIDPRALAGQLALAARYYIFKAPPHLFTSVQATLPLDLQKDEMGERTVFQKINLAAPIKYKFNDMFGAFFGDNLLDVEVEPEFGLALNFPVSVGVQANDNVFALVATNLARIDLDETSAEHFGDRIPLAITGLYAFDYTLDAVASVNFTNLLDSTDLPNVVSVIVGVNYRGGFAN